MNRRYDSVPLMGRKVTLRATEAAGVQVEELRANAPRPRCFPRVVWTLVTFVSVSRAICPGVCIKDTGSYFIPVAAATFPLFELRLADAVIFQIGLLLPFDLLPLFHRSFQRPTKKVELRGCSKQPSTISP